ncbi:MAG: hypothetical protein NVSMB29_10220 [Candidatus Dormibacteria bacterium]
MTKRLFDRLSGHLLEEGGTHGPLSKHSVYSYLRPVNQLLNWAREDGTETTGKAQLPRLPRKLLNVLSREEIRAMEDAAVTERDALMLRVMADTGIRVGELVRLRTGDLIGDKNERYLKIRGKGDRERRVPLTPGLAVRVRKYVEKRRPKEADTDRLFVRYGGALPRGGMSRSRNQGSSSSRAGWANAPACRRRCIPTC